MTGVRDVFEHHRGFQGVARSFADGEGSMMREQNGGRGADMFEDRLADVVALIIDVRDAGNFAAELVGDRGEERGD